MGPSTYAPGGLCLSRGEERQLLLGQREQGCARGLGGPASAADDAEGRTGVEAWRPIGERHQGVPAFAVGE